MFAVFCTNLSAIHISSSAEILGRRGFGDLRKQPDHPNIRIFNICQYNKYVYSTTRPSFPLTAVTVSCIRLVGPDGRGRRRGYGNFGKRQLLRLLRTGAGRRRDNRQSRDDARQVSLAIEFQLASIAAPQAAFALTAELVSFIAARIK